MNANQISVLYRFSDFQRFHVCPVLYRFQTSNVFMYVQFCIAFRLPTCSCMASFVSLSDFQRFHVYPILYRF